MPCFCPSQRRGARGTSAEAACRGLPSHGLQLLEEIFRFSSTAANRSDTARALRAGAPAAAGSPRRLGGGDERRESLRISTAISASTLRFTSEPAFEPGHELAVACVVVAGGGVDAHDPQAAEFALLLFAVARRMASERSTWAPRCGSSYAGPVALRGAVRERGGSFSLGPRLTRASSYLLKGFSAQAYGSIERTFFVSAFDTRRRFFSPRSRLAFFFASGCGASSRDRA